MENEEGNKEKAKKFAKGRGIETLFRVSLANQLELISLADQKANIIIGINTFIISIVLVLGAGVRTTGLDISRMADYIPVIVLILFCLASGIFSILAAKPVRPVVSRQRHGVLYSRKHTKFDIDSYISELNNILHSKEEIYESLGADMYYQDLAIGRKYKLLRISYLCFLAGLVLAVLLFLVFLLF